MIEVVPAIIPDDYEQLEEEINKVSGLVKSVQIDVIDGKFAPSKSWPYNHSDDEKWQKLLSQDEGLPHWQDLNFSVDLMVEDQISAARDWINTGVNRIIGHIESLQDEDINTFKNFKKEMGVEIVFALKPSTPNSVLDEHLDDLDAVQFMGNDKIGYHGVELNPLVLDKIKELRTKRPDLPIGIDIGVKFETIPDLAVAGVTRFSSGSLVLNSSEPRETIAEIKRLAEKA